MRENVSVASIRVLLILIMTLFVGIAYAQCQEDVLYSFSSTSGYSPYSGLIFDAAGNPYGTTVTGGAYGYGTVFELMPNRSGGWTEITLHDFSDDGTDGSGPQGLIFDAAGNLYGTTSRGGASKFGTVFELTPNGSGGWAETILHSFYGKNGNGPVGSLIFDAAGNLYGTTGSGGAYHYYGTAFELTPNGSGGWTEILLHSFNDNGTDGCNPQAGLVFDSAGNLYGTTWTCGAYGGGTVFGLKRNKVGGGWSERVLHNFRNNGKDGFQPASSLVVDATGNLYGTTVFGGAGPNGEGTVFGMRHKLGGGWEEGVLHSFGSYGTDGSQPYAAVLFDSAGNLYGTTELGGAQGLGAVFGMRHKPGGGWEEGVLHSFDNNGTDGSYPQAGVILDDVGDLYGTTTQGGADAGGVAFELEP